MADTPDWLRICPVQARNAPPRDHAEVRLRGASLSAADFRRTVRGRCSPVPVAPDGTAGLHRPPSGAGTERQTSSELRETTDAAGQQRYVASGWTTADSASN